MWLDAVLSLAEVFMVNTGDVEYSFIHTVLCSSKTSSIMLVVVGEYLTESVKIISMRVFGTLIICLAHAVKSKMKIYIYAQRITDYRVKSMGK